MKMTRNNTIAFRISFLLLALLVLTASMILPISAASDSWEMTDDETTITRGDERYEAYRLPIGYSIRPQEIYLYSDPIDYHKVMSNEKNGGLVWLESYGRSDVIYATDEAYQSLEPFFEGESKVFYFVDDSNRLEWKVPTDFVDTLNTKDSDTVTAKLNVWKDLYSAPRYDLYAYDESGTVYFIYGAIYEVNERHYYVNYQELGNEYFDADGNFSYRSGSVYGKLLTEAIGSFDPVPEQFEEDPYYSIYTYEEGDYFTPEPLDDSPILFWGCYILIGFIIPTVALVIGLILPRNQKLGKPVYWYSMAIAAGVWILASLVLMIMLL